MVNSEDSDEVISHKFPIPEKRLGDIQEGERIRSLPASLIFSRLFERVPNSKIVQKNAYGEMGGDLIQHGNLQSRIMALRDQRVDAMIEGVNQEAGTVRIKVTLPTFGNEALWGNSAEKTVVLPYDDLLGPIDKLKRVIGKLLRKRK
jgi:hypothetical protein